ncbi:DsbA family protein [Streptomyces sp. XM4193]|uniref:thioredoxin domain-containing protein n=1 Tax=Streptomyces sp. XM4193 TaxID=2929782 RepID=UPI001FFC27D6|nr:thioredoxin domain-containing protein [Streptomyces sp. XM4193]MCK1796382.1 DsbA family protein [Streptomyces sp. XM4193]
MSKRNSQEAKRVARERLRLEREKQAKREKARRQLTVAAAVVGALALIGGAGFAVSQMMKDDTSEAQKHWDDAEKVAEGEKTAGRYTSYEKPDNTAGKQGVDIVIGDKDAKNTVTIYEDMRCPVCASFEQANGETVSKDIEDGKYKAEYVFGTFLDDAEAIAGTGSRNALSALGAALNESPEAFMELKKIFYSKDKHPEERSDDFGDDENLIELAQGVEELKGNKAFEKAVKNGTYDPWAVNMDKKFEAAKDVTGTPSLKVNGKKIETGQGTAPMAPQQFEQMVHGALEK